MSAAYQGSNNLLPLNDSPGALEEEEVTVTDPGHPLYGRRFPVASRPRGPGAKGNHVDVRYHDAMLLRIPAAAIAPPKTGRLLHESASPDQPIARTSAVRRAATTEQQPPNVRPADKAMRLEAIAAAWSEQTGKPDVHNLAF